MAKIESKTGNGAFEVRMERPGVVYVTIENDMPRVFSSAKVAYDRCIDGYRCLQGSMRGFSYLNAAYALEDMMGEV